MKADPEVERLHNHYEGEFTEQNNIHEVLYSHQVVTVDGERTGGDPDLAKLFMERSPQLLSKGGYVGLVVPSAFHANEGATGIRWLFLDELAVRCCYSFENRRKLFEIHRSFKFALVVAAAGSRTTEFACAFYLQDDEWLFRDRQGREPLKYTGDFVRRTGGSTASFLELRSAEDLAIAEQCFRSGESFGRVSERLGICLGRELHMTDDAWRFTPTGDVLDSSGDPRDPEIMERLVEMGYIVLHEGKTFRQYEDRWGDALVT